MGEQQTTILVLGGANTGRSPMAAALLQRLLEEHELPWLVRSAGVIGYDGDPAEPEARMVMTHYGLDITNHAARSLTDELVEDVAMLLAIDTSIANVVRMRFESALPRTVTLGELAQRNRNIPDPHRMQLGAWLSYAEEIDAMLQEGIEELIQRVSHALGQEAPVPAPAPAAVEYNQTVSAGGEREETDAVEEQAVVVEQVVLDSAQRCGHVLNVLRDMPGLIEWPNAQNQLVTEVRTLSTTCQDASTQVYANLVLVLLGMMTTLPTTSQFAMLRETIERFRSPMHQDDITALSRVLAEWRQGE